MTDAYADALGFAEASTSAPDADLAALWGRPPGYLKAAQWILLGESTPQEMLAAMKALELHMTQRAADPTRASADSVSTMAVWPAQHSQERVIVRRSIRRGQSGRIRGAAGGHGHA